jgi:hypothetical protein
MNSTRSPYAAADETATCVLVWELLSGRIAKFFCDEHSKDASPQPYFVSKLIGYREQVKSTNEEEESPSVM